MTFGKISVELVLGLRSYSEMECNELKLTHKNEISLGQ